MANHKLIPSGWLRRESEKNLMPGRHGSLAHDVFHSGIDRMFDEFVNSIWGGMPAAQHEAEGFLRPSLDLRETDKEYALSVELPGVNEEDINIEIAPGNTLVISGEKKSEHEEGEKGKGAYRMERRYGSFYRALALPEDVKADAISASYTKGVLTVTIPKGETPGSRKIEIKKG